MRRRNPSDDEDMRRLERLVREGFADALETARYLRPLQSLIAAGGPESVAAQDRWEEVMLRRGFVPSSIDAWLRVAHEAYNQGLQLYIFSGAGDLLGRVWHAETVPGGRPPDNAPTWKQRRQTSFDFVGRLGVQGGLMGERYVPLYTGRPQDELTRLGAWPVVSLGGRAYPDETWRPRYNALSPQAREAFQIPRLPLTSRNDYRDTFGQLRVGNVFRFASEETAPFMGTTGPWAKISARTYVRWGADFNPRGPRHHPLARAEILPPIQID